MICEQRIGNFDDCQQNQINNNSLVQLNSTLNQINNNSLVQLNSTLVQLNQNKDRKFYSVL